MIRSRDVRPLVAAAPLVDQASQRRTGDPRNRALLPFAEVGGQEGRLVLCPYLGQVPVDLERFVVGCAQVAEPASVIVRYNYTLKN